MTGNPPTQLPEDQARQLAYQNEIEFFGAILIGGDFGTADKLDPADFVEFKHQKIFGAMREMYNTDRASNLMPALIADAVKDPSARDYLFEIKLNTASDKAIQAYVDNILAHSISRQSTELYGRLVKARSQNNEKLATSIEEQIKSLGDRSTNKGDHFSLKVGWEGYNEHIGYLIKGHLPSQSVIVVFGASASLKTFHVLNWSAHIALGREWNGCRVDQGAVLYVCGEGGLGVRQRIRALANEYNNGEQIEQLYRIDHAVTIGQTADANQLLKTIKAEEKRTGVKFNLIVLDTLARMFAGVGDENSATDMGAFVASCDRIKIETGASVLLVHHSGVTNKDRARGSSALLGGVDVEYRIEREAKELGYTLINTKTKDAGEPEPEYFEMKKQFLFTDNDGDQVFSLVASDTGIEPPEKEEEITPLNKNEQSVWGAVRARQEAGAPTSWALVQGDVKSQYEARDEGKKVKYFYKWVEGCVTRGVLTVDPETKVISTKS